MDKVNVIFLDIDGVICNPRAYCHNYKGVDPVAVALLNKIDNEIPNLRYVVSSTWRTDPSIDTILHVMGIKISRLYKEEAEELLQRKIKEDDPELNKTPKNWYEGKLRGHEIQEWLDCYGSIIENYVIIDDDSDMLPEQFNYFVKTDVYDGLGYRDTQKAIFVLKGNKLEDWSDF